MMGFALRLVLAFLGNALCERIRPTEHYSWEAMVRVNDGPWERRGGAAGFRRPWERYPAKLVGPQVTFDEAMALNPEGNLDMSVTQWTVVRES